MAKVVRKFNRCAAIIVTFLCFATSASETTDKTRAQRIIQKSKQAEEYSTVSYVTYLSQACAAKASESACLTYEALKELATINKTLHEQVDISFLTSADWSAHDIRSAFFFISPLAEELSIKDTDPIQTIVRWIFLRYGISKSIPLYMESVQAENKFEKSILAAIFSSSLWNLTTVSRSYHIGLGVECEDHELECKKVKADLLEGASHILPLIQEELNSLTQLNNDLPAEFQFVVSRMKQIGDLEAVLEGLSNVDPQDVIRAGLGLPTSIEVTNIFEAYKNGLSKATTLKLDMNSRSLQGFSIGLLYLNELQKLSKNMKPVTQPSNEIMSQTLVQSTVSEMNEIKLYLKEIANGLPQNL